MNMGLEKLVNTIRDTYRVLLDRTVGNDHYMIFLDKKGKGLYVLLPEHVIQAYKTKVNETIEKENLPLRVVLKDPREVLKTEIPGYKLIYLTTNWRGKLKNFYHMLKSYVKNFLIGASLAIPFLATYALGIGDKMAEFFGDLLLFCAALAALSGIKENIPYHVPKYPGILKEAINELTS